VAFQGLPARICWLGYGERDRAGLAFNDLVASGELKAPIVIGRDHLDSGSVASPYRETESMLDGSDAIADWRCSTPWLTRRRGDVGVDSPRGRGWDRSLDPCGQVCVADGRNSRRRSWLRSSETIPVMGVIRHVDAGYEWPRTPPKSEACAFRCARGNDDAAHQEHR